MGNVVFRGGLVQGSLVARLAKQCCGTASQGSVGFGLCRPFGDECDSSAGDSTSCVK